jgi:hypothetical protein
MISAGRKVKYQDGSFGEGDEPGRRNVKQATAI